MVFSTNEKVRILSALAFRILGEVRRRTTDLARISTK